MDRNAPPDQASVRPVTLHINKGKGTAVVQVQTTSAHPGHGMERSASAVTTVEKQTQRSQHHLPTVASMGTVPHASSSPVCGSITSSSVITSTSSSSRIFPASIALPSSSSLAAAAAAAAFGGYFYAPSATTDHMSAYQNLIALQQVVAAQQHHGATKQVAMPTPAQSVTFGASPSLFGATAAKYLSPVASNFGTELHQQLNSAAHQSRFGAGLTTPKLPTSPLNQHDPAAVFHGLSGSPTAPLYHYGTQSAVPAQAGSTTPGQSPRPSILRKRPIDPTTAAAVAASLCSSSTASKRLTYDASSAVPNRPAPHVLSTIVRRLTDMAPLAPCDDSTLTRLPLVAATGTTTSESVDAGNSNHSSSASTASASSSYNDVVNVCAGASLVPTSGVVDVASPSPRKRQRKQRLDDLPRENLPAPSSTPTMSTGAYWPPATLNVTQTCRQLGTTRSSPASSSGRSPYSGGVQSTATWSTVEHSSVSLFSLVDQLTNTTMQLQPISLPSNSRSVKSKVDLTKKTEQEPSSDDTSSTSSMTSSVSSDSNVQRPTLLSSDSVVAMSTNDTSSLHWRPRRNHFRRRDDVRDASCTMPSQKTSAGSSLLSLSSGAASVSQQNKVPMSIHELCQPSRRIADRVDAWRLHLVAQNLRELFRCQADNLGELDALLNAVVEEYQSDKQTVDTKVSPKSIWDCPEELRIIEEMILTSSRRCLAVRERLLDARGPLNRILQHRTNADEIVTKYAVRRTVRKKLKPA